MASTKKLVSPGDELGVEEEYFTGPGTYIDRKGKIRSQLLGKVLIDIVNRRIIVKHIKGKPRIPRQGDIVIGIVESVSNDLAFIDITSIENTNIKSTDFTGIIHISQASKEYLETMYDALRVGDVIRAKVLNNSNPYQLTIKDPNLGVIAAFCTKCGSLLKKQDDRLICPVCGNIEKRKTSILYMFR